MHKVDCQDWLLNQFGLATLVHGLTVREPMREYVASETLLGRHHQILVNGDLEMANHCKRPEGADRSLYTQGRHTERVDLYARPDLPAHRRWG